MTRLKDLAGLQELAQLTLDHQLDRMRAATVALERSKTQLGAINVAQESSDLPLVAAARAEMTYQRWADLRRSELNLVIARQTVDWLGEREKAKTAFGRLEALQGITARIGRR